MPDGPHRSLYSAEEERLLRLRLDAPAERRRRELVREDWNAWAARLIAAREQEGQG